MKIDRSKWKQCQFCRNRKRTILGLDRYNDEIYIATNNNDCAIESDSFKFLIEYCPKCGRPLTEQAWQELEGRIVRAD